MNDRHQSFERELKTLLAVKPSSDLQTRIRARAFAAPVRRTRWFGLASALATATVTIIIAVNFRGPEQPQPAPALQPTVVNTIPPATAPLDVPSQTQKPRRRPAPKRSAIIVTTMDTAMSAGTIESAPLTVLEVTGSLEPIPQTPALSIARLEPVHIEPLNLTVPNLE